MRTTKIDARVLVVDDNPVWLDMLTIALGHAGYQVVTCCNGQEALDLCAAGDAAFRVVVMDLNMPILDGRETTAIMRDRAGMRATPIVCVTADPTARERTEGWTEVLQKPIGPRAVVEVVKRLALASDSV